MTPHSSVEAAARLADDPVPGPVAARIDTPEALGHRFAECAARGDVEGIVALFAADAVVSLPAGREAAGPEAIRTAFAAALQTGVDLRVDSVGRPIVTGSLACTCSTDTSGQVHTQVARREPDGSWRWIRDGSRLREQPALRLEHLG
jgi:ketosteroid isomerase-like protein